MTFLTFAGLDSVNATTDPTALLIYVNDVTGGMAMPMVLLAFFLIAFMGTYFSEVRRMGRGRIDHSFAAAGFVTFGMAVIMSLRNGLLAPMYLYFSIGIALVGVLILYLSSES